MRNTRVLVVSYGYLFIVDIADSQRYVTGRYLAGGFEVRYLPVPVAVQELCTGWPTSTGRLPVLNYR